MKSKKKVQIITLLVVVILAATGTGIYFLTRDDDSQIFADSNPTETDRQDENNTMKNELDGLILLEGGTFTMGSPDNERQRGTDEVSHQVTVDAFYVDAYEVTQQDYEAVMGENPSHFSGANLPVENVTWYEAVQYCNALSERRGLTPVYTIEGNTVSWDRRMDGYRLLTEAEWEYAARAGTTTVFYDGNQITSDNANFEGSYPYLIEENYVTRHDPSVVTSTNRGKTIAVNSLAPNGFGLYNMYGNVSEWCFDYYGEYDLAQTVNPVGAKSGSLRVNRGGGYNDFAKQLRSAYRSATTPDTVEQNLGFRIARNAQPEKSIEETTYNLNIQTPENPHILVAYFSHTGNTENGAQMIEEQLGADLFEIQMTEPYRGNIYEVSQQDLNNDVRPALSSHVENMPQYDIVILGYPTWWSTMPMPVFTFLEEYEFSGKVILPFSSNGGTRFGDSISDLSKTAIGAYVGQGFEYTYSGGSSLSDDLVTWLSNNGIGVK
ncbi:MAG: SUMF1/EgtB/PvdO family nonheme iron enzyme [Clostridiales bacterium]|nr:SUMF1/EgtB/PvdO family nonheme iron enzyme [Clostridiales bacterium]